MRVFIALFTASQLFATTFSPSITYTRDNQSGNKKKYKLELSKNDYFFHDNLKTLIGIYYSSDHYDNFHELKSFKLQELTTGNFLKESTLNGYNRAININFVQEASKNLRIGGSYGKTWSNLSNESSTSKLTFENDLFGRTHLLSLSLIYTRIYQKPESISGHSGTIYIPNYEHSLITLIKDNIILSKYMTMELNFAYRQKSDRPEALYIGASQSTYIETIDAAIHLSGTYFDEKNDIKYNSLYGSITGYSVGLLWAQNIIDIFNVDLGYKFYTEKEELINRPAFAKLASDTFSIKAEWSISDTFPINIELFLSLEYQKYKTNRDLASDTVLFQIRSE